MKFGLGRGVQVRLVGKIGRLDAQAHLVSRFKRLGACSANLVSSSDGSTANRLVRSGISVESRFGLGPDLSMIPFNKMKFELSKIHMHNKRR